MNKKTPILVLASALLLGGLAGCGGLGDQTTAPSSESKPVETSSAETTTSSDLASSSDTDTSSSEEVPAHVHTYNADHICETDGYSEPGALSVDLDGDLSDAKWTALTKANSLFDLGEDGRGLKIKGFTDETCAYFAFEIVSNLNVFANIEIIFNGDANTQTTVTIEKDGYTHWGTRFMGAVAKITKGEDEHYHTVVEIAAKLDSVKGADGAVRGAFGAVMTGEKSSSSYSDAQIEYWVLKGINPWAGSNFLVDAEGIHHTHSYKDGKCVWCDEAVPETPMAVNPDGDPSDWNADIAKKYIGTSDTQGKHFGWNAFTDDTYLYVTTTLIHQSAHVTQVHMLRLDEGKTDATEENIVNYTGTGYSYGGTGFIKGGYKEAIDDASGFTKTTFELVFLKTSWTVGGKVNIGLLAHVPADSDSSEHFDINHSGIPGYWGITSGHNSWGPGGRFDVTSEGVVHTHSFSEGKCLLCGEKDPNAEKTYDIVLDGDFSDWDSEVLATKVSDSDPAGPAIGFVAFEKNGYYYVGMEATAKDRVVFDLLDKEANEIMVDSTNGKVTIYSDKGSRIEQFGGKCVTDSETGYTTTYVELVIPTSKLSCPELGIVVQAMGDETSSVIGLGSTGWDAHMWVVKGLNPWGYRFGISDKGLTHTHSYKNGKCIICNQDEPAPTYTPAITVDGDLSDFSEAAKNTKITDDASNGEGTALTGFADDHYAYVGLEVKTTSAGVSNVDICGKVNTAYVGFTVADGVISTGVAGVSCASSRTKDETSGIYTYTFEIALPKDKFTVEENGSVKLGISINGCSNNAELSCNSPDQNNYWGINNLNAWWGEAHCFTFSTTGLAAPSSSSGN